MNEVQTFLLQPATGFRSPLVALFVAQTSASLVDADLDRMVTQTRPDGTRRAFSLHRMFYHLLEHEAGHFGQVLPLRHLCRTLGPGAAV